MIQNYFNRIKAQNARHRPLLHSLDHKHTPEQVVETLAPTLEDVLAEIAMVKGWV